MIPVRSSSVSFDPAAAALVHEIAQLKQQSGKNFAFWGDSIFPNALMDPGLIDDYWINLHPVILGQGKPLLTDNSLFGYH